MESDGGRETIQPVTAEEEALKRNTDCVYFLASPLTCKKGSECEYRHSDGARINPRDCWYWLNGNCLNPKCSFRHPPLDSLFSTQMPTSGQVPPQSTSTRIPAAHGPPNNINKQNVPCYYFQWGQCLKGERCPFLHGPQASISFVTQQVAKASTCLAEPAQTSQKVQQNATELNLGKPKVTTETPSATSKFVAKAVNAPNNELLKSKILPPHSLDVEPPALQQNVVPTSNGYSLSKPWSHHVQSLDQQPENGRDTDEFLQEYSPGFDVLVEDDIKDADYFHNEDNFRMVSVHGGQNLEPEDDYDYHHSDYEPMTKIETDRCNGIGKYDNYKKLHGRFGWEPKTSDRILDKPSPHERTVLDRETKLEEMDGSDLRHRLLKQRRLNGSRSSDNPDGRREPYQRDEHYAEERDYDRHSRDRRQWENPLSTRLQGRITFPERSTDTASKFPLEKERGRRSRDRLSPIRQINNQARHPERKRQQPVVEFSKDARSTSNKPTGADGANSLDFAGPKSLAELKCAKINENFHEQSIKSTISNTKLNKVKSRDVEGLQESENSVSFQGPMPLSVILKRKRELGCADSGISTNQYENNQGGGESAINESVPVLQSDTPVEVEKEGNHTIGSHEGQNLRAVEGVIPTEEELTCDGQSSRKTDAVETEDGMDLENVEEEEVVNYDQRDGDFDYETGEFRADDAEIRADDAENTFQGNEDELDDEDDFARKVSVMLS